jgi:hypothetical protein
MRTLIISFVAALAACGGSDNPPADDQPPGDDIPGNPDAPPQAVARANLVFAVANGVRQNPNLDDPLTGTVYGQIFRSADVTLLGPNDGAMEYGAVEVPGVDLITATTAGMWMSPELPADDYTFLGFFDVDGNGGVDRSPDAGDPVTIPTTNQFEIVAGVTTPVMVTATFDFVLN